MNINNGQLKWVLLIEITCNWMIKYKLLIIVIQINVTIWIKGLIVKQYSYKISLWIK